MIKLLSLLALVMTIVGTFLLYRGTLLPPGAIQFIGGNRTQEQISADARRQKIERWVALTVLLLAAAVQAAVIFVGRL